MCSTLCRRRSGGLTRQHATLTTSGIGPHDGGKELVLCPSWTALGLRCYVARISPKTFISPGYCRPFRRAERGCALLRTASGDCVADGLYPFRSTSAQFGPVPPAATPTFEMLKTSSSFQNVCPLHNMSTTRKPPDSPNSTPPLSSSLNSNTETLYSYPPFFPISLTTPSADVGSSCTRWSTRLHRGSTAACFSSPVAVPRCPMVARHS